MQRSVRRAFLCRERGTTGTAMTSARFFRGNIDVELRDRGRDIESPNSIGYGYTLPDRTKPDYVPNQRHGRVMAMDSRSPKSSNHSINRASRAVGRCDKDVWVVPFKRFLMSAIGRFAALVSLRMRYFVLSILG